MLKRLARVLGPPQPQRVRSRRCLPPQLIQRQALPPGLFDARARGGGEAERGHRELGHGEEAVVVRDRAYHHDGLAAVRLFRVRVRGQVGEAGEGEGRPVDARHEEAAEDDLVEVRVGTAWENAGRWSVSGVACFCRCSGRFGGDCEFLCRGW